MFKSFKFSVQMTKKQLFIFEWIFMIEYFILKLGFSNTEKALTWEVNSRPILRSEEYVKRGTFPQ